MSFKVNSGQQISFNDSVFSLTAREKKALDNSWAKIFADEIFPNIDEERFSVLYSSKASRPNAPVNVIIGALIIKELFDYSDDEIVENLMLDLHLQYALHTTSFEEQPISDKTLSRFRSRCYNYETTHGIDLYHDCVKDLSSKIAKLMNLSGRIKRMDSMMIESNIRFLSRMELIYTCISKLAIYFDKNYPNKIPDDLKHYTDSNDYNRIFYHQLNDNMEQIIQAPSLLALIPLVVYIVLVFRGKNNVSGIIVGIFLAVLMLGQNLKAVSVGLAASLGSSTALIGMIIMAGAGLGVLMTEAGVSRTMVYWIVKRIGVNTQTKAKIALIICSIIICGLLGTLGGGNAVIAPILIPIMASLGITPSVVASLFKVSGEIGLMVGPLTGVTLITEEVTGLSYGQLMVGAVLPFSAVWLIGMWIAANRTQKRTAGKEYYELSDDIKNFDSIVISAQEKRATVAFLITFVVLVGYGIYSKQGTNYALTVMCILAAVVAIFSRIDHSGSVTGKVPERVTEKEKKISELLVEAPEAINGSPQVHTSYASH